MHAPAKLYFKASHRSDIGMMQAALTRDIQTTLQAWRPQLDAASQIYVHAPSTANSAPIFGGEAPCLTRGDARIRRIPFTTRRPTFSETKRVLQVQHSIRCFITMGDGTGWVELKAVCILCEATKLAIVLVSLVQGR